MQVSESPETPAFHANLVSDATRTWLRLACHSGPFQVPVSREGIYKDIVRRQSWSCHRIRDRVSRAKELSFATGWSETMHPNPRVDGRWQTQLRKVVSCSQDSKIDEGCRVLQYPDTRNGMTDGKPKTRTLTPENDCSFDKQKSLANLSHKRATASPTTPGPNRDW